MKVLLIFQLLFLGLAVEGHSQEKARQGVESEARQETTKLRIAASQHEIIAVLLAEGNYDRILPEYRKILALGFQGESELLVVKEAWIIVDQLRNVGQYELSHQIVDLTLDATRQGESHFNLLMLKGKIYYDQGLSREAIEAYHRAQRIRE